MLPDGSEPALGQWLSDCPDLPRLTPEQPQRQLGAKYLHGARPKTPIAVAFFSYVPRAALEADDGPETPSDRHSS